MKFHKKILVAAVFAIPVLAFASSISTQFFVQVKSGITEAFKTYKIVTPKISTPKVLEVPFQSDISSVPIVAVYNTTANEFEPNFVSLKIDRIEIKNQISVSSGAIGRGMFASDNNYGTYVEFPISADRDSAELTFTFEKPITTSSLNFVLDSNVALPQDISVHADVNGSDYIALGTTGVYGNNISFPKTTASVWHVFFDYVQPLRISEIKFNDMTSADAQTQGVRFLAQPNQSYEIYFNADRYVSPQTLEAGDLSSNEGVVLFPSALSLPNPEYTPADADNDSVPDLKDNCVSVANSDQLDSDGNGRGDACEDYDRDGVVNASDDCINTPNASQEDTDKDGMGDACDSKDNRVAESLPWLPWAGIGIAGIVVLGLFVVVVKHKPDAK